MDRNEGRDYPALVRAYESALAGGQMPAAQYFRIAAEILSRAPCRVLIFGAGADTELYVCANRGGRTAVIERHREWAARVRHLPCEVFEVVYSSVLRDGLAAHCDPPAGLPEGLLLAGWDVILVDGPEGYGPTTPGRQQSICAAALAAVPGATVFVHDFERDMERRAAGCYLGEPEERLGSRPTLATFRIRPVTAVSGFA